MKLYRSLVRIAAILAIGAGAARSAPPEPTAARIDATVEQLHRLGIRLSAADLERIAQLGSADLYPLQIRLLARVRAWFLAKNEDAMVRYGTANAGRVQVAEAKRVLRQLVYEGIDNSDLLDYVRSFTDEIRAPTSPERTRRFIRMLKNEAGEFWKMPDEFAGWIDDANLGAVVTMLTWCSDDPILHAVGAALGSGDDVALAFLTLGITGPSLPELPTMTRERLSTIARLGHELRTLTEKRMVAVEARP